MVAFEKFKRKGVVCAMKIKIGLFALVLGFVALQGGVAMGAIRVVSREGARFGQGPINVAHRGACGYLPEHSLPAKALAYGLGADYIEQDVCVTKDLVPIVAHDIYLNHVTDVAERFPGRAREDGRFYIVDFTYKEILTLRVNERMNEDGEQRFKGRFPAGKSSFRLHRFEDELEMIQGMNRVTGRDVGIYPEIKEPEWHRQNGVDISLIMLTTLYRYGYSKAESRCFLQSFDGNELKRVRNQLGCKLKLVQLLEPEDSYDFKDIAGYAQGVGPAIAQLVGWSESSGYRVTDFVARAHEVGLQVHPYTFRVDSLPEGMSARGLLEALFRDARVDGIFSDFPDVSGEFIKNLP